MYCAILKCGGSCFGTLLAPINMEREVRIKTCSQKNVNATRTLVTTIRSQDDPVKNSSSISIGVL